MNCALGISICFALGFQVRDHDTQQRRSELAHYWYGDPLRQGTFVEVLKDMPRAILATLDAKELAALEKLKTLGFRLPAPSHFRVTQKDGKRIAALPPGITLYSPGLDLRGKPPITPADLRPLADLRHVERLDLRGKLVDDDMMDLLAGMELCHFNALDVRITDAGLKKLGQLKKLRMLRIDSADITDAGAATLAMFPVLESVYLDRSQVTDAGVILLTANPNLREVRLTERKPLKGARELVVGDVGVAALASMRQLEVLVLAHSRVTDAGLATIAKPGNCPRLAGLTLSWAAITDAGIMSLHDAKALPGLKRLDLSRTKVTPAAVMALQLARPRLDITAEYADGTRYRTAINGPK
jgi:hypothetical protein